MRGIISHTIMPGAARIAGAKMVCSASTDRECRLCFALALWNGRDPILKERLFGLTNPQGNHGEDVKEAYYYLDATPTYSYCRGLYKYPQSAYPYAGLIEENARRSRESSGSSKFTTPASSTRHRYFDVFIEYAKADVPTTF